MMFWASMTETICSIISGCDQCESLSTYSLLELGQVGRAEGIGLGDDGDQVDARAKALHDLNVEGLEGVAGRANEVQAGMDTEIDLVLATGLLLLKHVRLVLVVEELDDGHPRVAVVDIVAEARGVDNGQSDWEQAVLASVGQRCCVTGAVPLKNFSSSSALVISISTVLSTCFW